MSGNQSSFSSMQQALTKQLESLEKRLKKKGLIPRSTSLSLAQVAISSFAFLLLLIGLVSATALVRIEQDVRQQAQGPLYSGRIGGSCSSVQQGQYGCDNDSNTRIVCDGRQWRTTGQTCESTASESNGNLPTAQEIYEEKGGAALRGLECGVDIALDSNGKCTLYVVDGISVPN